MTSTLANGRGRAGSEEEWTPVRHRKGRRIKPAGYTAQSHFNGNAAGPGRRPSFLSLSDVETENKRIADQWRTSTCHHKLRDIFASRICPRNITHAICFGLGSFDPEDGSWESRRRAHVQLAAFLSIVEQLQCGNPHTIRCIFQEPIFNAVDKAFIHTLGHEVVDSPEGFDRVSPSALVFGVHLYRGVYTQAIINHAPAVFVGTPCEVWEECHSPDALDWPSLKELDKQCDKAEFPEEAGYTTFSTTAIHWRR